MLASHVPFDSKFNPDGARVHQRKISKLGNFCCCMVCCLFVCLFVFWGVWGRWRKSKVGSGARFFFLFMGFFVAIVVGDRVVASE